MSETNEQFAARMCAKRTGAPALPLPPRLADEWGEWVKWVKRNPMVPKDPPFYLQYQGGWFRPPAETELEYVNRKRARAGLRPLTHT